MSIISLSRYANKGITTSRGGPLHDSLVNLFRIKITANRSPMRRFVNAQRTPRSSALLTLWRSTTGT